MMNRLSDTARLIALEAPRGRLSLSLVSSASQQPRPRVLLLHGSPADMDDWCTLARELGEAVELAAVDLPGFGRSDAVAPIGTGLLDSFADCVQDAMTRLRWVEPFYVLGHSHGAGVAQALAVRHPRSVAGLILIASIGSPAHSSYRQLAVPGVAALLQVPAVAMKLRLARPMMRSILRAIMRPMFHPLPLPEARVDQQLEAFAQRPEMFVQMARVARGGPCEQLARNAQRIAAPVLFIHGDGDQIVPAAHAGKIRALLSGECSVAFEVIPGAGHMLHCTHAAAASKLILSWLRHASASAAAEMRTESRAGHSHRTP